MLESPSLFSYVHLQDSEGSTVYGGGPVHRARNFNGFATGSPKLLLRMCLYGYFFGVRQ